MPLISAESMENTDFRITWIFLIMGPPFKGSDSQMLLISAEFLENAAFNKICNKEV